MKEIILASSSVARASILQKLDLPFSINAQNIDESSFADESAQELVLRLACAKARACLKANPHSLCIGADTVAVLGGTVFGKPQDAEEARQMLYALSGQKHSIFTGLCLVQEGKIDCALERTDITFRHINSDEIELHISQDDWRGHAAAYALQDSEDFIEKIDGSRSNVIGLPLNLLCKMLEGFAVYSKYTE